MVSPRVKSGLLLGFGSVLVVLGAIAVIFWPAVFVSQLQRMLTLTSQSMSYEIWREVPLPMYLECHFFNITNVDEILAGQNVPIKVEQLGPYVYREQQRKADITWNDNSTVTFYNERFWHYEEDMSNGSLSDMITSINPVVVTVAYILRNQPLAIRLGADVFMRLYHSDMFLTANVSSWLFDGIDDRVIDIGQYIPIVSGLIPYDKFGWFYTRNGSVEYDGVFNMNTGQADFSKLGNVETWQYSSRTVYRDECGEVKGSPGELWAPEFDQQEVNIFASDICTYIILGRNDTAIVEGIEGVVFAANDSIFDNGYRYPRMACYCHEVRDENCLPPGALNVSDCRYGAPAFVSLPHFLNSDPYYPSKIEGLDPKPEMNFRLTLEMLTGIPLEVSAQLQINMLVRHVGGVSLSNQLPDEDVLVPMFWFRQEVAMTEEYAALARQALRLRYWMPYGLAALTVIGTVLLVAGVAELIKRVLRSSDTAPILTDTPVGNDSQ